jgi:PAS domain-containing protein
MRSVRDAADPLVLAQAALNLRRACDQGQSPEAMLDGMLRILAELTHFDIATYVEYATDSADRKTTTPVLVRGRYAVDRSERFDWPARWIRAPMSMMEWVDGKELAVPDILAFFRANPSLQSLRRNPVVQTYIKRGARSFVVSVHRENGVPVSSLTLARRGSLAFGAVDQDLLENIGLPEVLRLVRAAYEAEAAAFRLEIRDLFAQRAAPDEIAHAAVQRICQRFRWDYAAVFRVAHARARFELVEQHNASEKRLLIERNYTQSLDVGVLGRVLKAEQPMRVENTRGRHRHGYKQIAQDAHSCLCYPIMVDGYVEWIIDCESSEVGAFQYPDEEELGKLIREAQRSIALWFEARMNRALLENIEQGVIVVDMANRITRLNTLAGQLLGAPLEEVRGGQVKSPMQRSMAESPLRNELLCRFAADEEAKAVLTSGHVAAKPLNMCGADGLVRHVVASSRDVEDAFNRRIWRLTDPKVWDWVTALEYMRTTVQGVAQQTRGPLLLANALVSRARGLVGDNPDLRSLLTKARANLAKTDITYERLVVGLDAERNPLGRPVAVDMWTALESFIGDLPEEDRTALQVSHGGMAPAAWVDPERLRFVFHSTIGYLLGIRLPGSSIALQLSGGPRHVSLCLTTRGGKGEIGFTFQRSAADPVARARADAQEATSHAFSTVRKIIESHHGTLRLSRQGGRLMLILTLPAAPRERTGPKVEMPGHA